MEKAMSNYAVEKRNVFENKMQKFTMHRKKVALFIYFFFHFKLAPAVTDDME